MSLSLQVQNGDLVLEGTSLATVEGPQKLTQDLGCGILTPMGTDESHPGFGSILDGGVLPNGQHAEGVIGETDWNRASLLVQSEIQRICGEYQKEQIARNQTDGATYGKPTLVPSEILVSVESIRTIQAQDHLLATVTLKTGNGPIQVNIPVADGTLLNT